ncbi:MAG: hypothetical protein EOP11_26695 [Proteobacteria bacterium]|nr:MAG: hypothetical protein EOP11_26695 [Pseudomonadota bacterium]
MKHSLRLSLILALLTSACASSPSEPPAAPPPHRAPEQNVDARALETEFGACMSSFGKDNAASGAEAPSELAEKAVKACDAPLLRYFELRSQYYRVLAANPAARSLVEIKARQDTQRLETQGKTLVTETVVKARGR